MSTNTYVILLGLLTVSCRDLQQVPAWLSDILSGDNYLRVDNFDKYVHGTAVLYPEVDDSHFPLSYFSALRVVYQ